jgi:hypothetical protein
MGAVGRSAAQGCPGAMGICDHRPFAPRGHRAHGHAKVDWVPRAAMGPMGPAFACRTPKRCKGRIRDAICGHAPRSTAEQYEHVHVEDIAEAMRKFPRWKPAGQ